MYKQKLFLNKDLVNNLHYNGISNIFYIMYISSTNSISTTTKSRHTHHSAALRVSLSEDDDKKSRFSIYY